MNDKEYYAKVEAYLVNAKKESENKELDALITETARRCDYNGGDDYEISVRWHRGQ